jgi:hypothetical protein
MPPFNGEETLPRTEGAATPGGPDERNAWGSSEATMGRRLSSRRPMSGCFAKPVYKTVIVAFAVALTSGLGPDVAAFAVSVPAFTVIPVTCAV